MEERDSQGDVIIKGIKSTNKTDSFVKRAVVNVNKNSTRKIPEVHG